MRAIFTTFAACTLMLAAGCESEAERRAEEQVEAEAEARGAAGLDEDLREIAAGEAAEFEEERKTGEALGQRVYGDTPREAESPDPLRETIIEDEE